MHPDILGQIDPAGRRQEGSAGEGRRKGCNRNFLALGRWRSGGTAGTSGSAVGFCCHYVWWSRAGKSRWYWKLTEISLTEFLFNFPDFFYNPGKNGIARWKFYRSFDWHWSWFRVWWVYKHLHVFEERNFYSLKKCVNNRTPHRPRNRLANI